MSRLWTHRQTHGRKCEDRARICRIRNCVKPTALPFHPPTSEEETRREKIPITFENWPKNQECLLTAQVHPSSISVGAFTSEKPFSLEKILENKKAEMASDSLSSSSVHLGECAKLHPPPKKARWPLSIHRKAKLDPAIWKSPTEFSFVRVP